MTGVAKTSTGKTPRRRGHNGGEPAPDQVPVAGDRPTKLDLLLALLRQPEGASIADLVAATGWQAHSVRGALAGSLKKKGHMVVSEKMHGLRRYRVGAAS